MKNFALSGNLGLDPKLQKKDETSYLTLRIASNARRTDWFWITCFGTLAENAAKILKKGDGIAVHGHLRSTTYNDKERIELIAENAQFFPKKRS